MGLGNIAPDSMLVAQERQYKCLISAGEAIKQALLAAQAGTAFDALCLLIEEAIGPLLELTGQRVSQAVVDELFSKFCVGK